MYKLILTLMGITVLVLFMPAFPIGAADEKHKPAVRRFCRLAPWGILAMYGLSLLCLTLFFRKPGSHSEITLSLLEPFRKAVRNNGSDFSAQMEAIFLNILLFFPLGYLLPFNFHRMKNTAVLAIGLIVTGVIELCQLVFQMGWFDVNDLLYNFIGVLCGLILLRVQQKE